MLTYATGATTLTEALNNEPDPWLVHCRACDAKVAAFDFHDCAKWRGQPC